MGPNVSDLDETDEQIFSYQFRTGVQTGIDVGGQHSGSINLLVLLQVRVHIYPLEVL